MAMHILMAVMEALKIPADDLILNRSSLQLLRENNRHKMFGEAKSDFIDNVIHVNLLVRIISVDLFLLFTFLEYNS